MMLSGCLTAKPASAVRVELLTPPNALLMPCEKPKVVINTNKDLLQGYIVTKGALDRCAAQVTAISDWSITAKTPAPNSLP